MQYNRHFVKPRTGRRAAFDDNVRIGIMIVEGLNRFSNRRQHFCGILVIGYNGIIHPPGLAIQVTKAQIEYVVVNLGISDNFMNAALRAFAHKFVIVFG